MHKHNDFLITDIPRKWAKITPDKEAIVFKETRLSWKEFYQRTNRQANALMELGLKQGDRVAVLSLNSHQYAESFYGIPKAGGITVPINYRLATREMAWIINNVEAGILIYEAGFHAEVEKMRSELGSVKHYLCINKVEGDDIDYEDLLAKAKSNEPEIALSGLDAEDVLWIGYTSGTEGTPKGAMLTQRNMMGNCHLVPIMDNSRFDDIWLTVTPQYHSVAIAHQFAHQYMGCKIVINETFDFKLLCETIQDEKVTVTFLVPAMIIFLLSWTELDKYDLTSLKVFSYGGAPTPEDTIKKAMDILNVELGQGFGMTELGPICALLLSTDQHNEIMAGKLDKRKLQSVGYPAFNVEVKILDDDDIEILEPEKVGEICVRGEQVMKGYWNNPEATEKALKDGWYHTGDLGIFDKDMFYYVVDRKKDMIISGAENIYSAEVENVISGHSAILESVVIGVPDEKWGEAVKALVVLNEGKQLSETELIDYCRDNLAHYKCPKSVEFWEEIPKNPMGKIKKFELREPYWKGYEKKVY